MRNLKFLAVMLFTALAAFSCGDDYDDTGIKKDIADLQSRVEKLEKWCDTANGQITSLQSLVTTLQDNDYVTGVTPVMEGEKEVGYTISFTKSQPVTIMHGTNGKDGVTPVIGVKKHTDNLYYWTIQTGSGEATWMKDAEGKMIPTTGKDGAAGQKPTISIAKDGDHYYWQIDGVWLVDANGQKVPATGDKGDSFFDSVTPDTTKGTIVIKLANGTVFMLPMLSTTVSFDAYTPLQIAVTGVETPIVVTLPTSLKKADFAAIKADITNVAGTNSAITRTTPEKWVVALTAPTFKQDGMLDAQPTVKVTVPASAVAGETALLEVTVVDTKGNKSISTRVLYYDNRVVVTGVTLAPETATVKVGKTATLTATVAPADATTKDVTWTSDKTDIATVTDGVVTGVKAGTATITVTTVDGNFTAICAVTVENIAVTGIALTDASISLNEKKTLVPTITPDDATNKKVSWKSDNTNIATVSDAGVVTGVAVGTATITATSEDGNKIATCVVTVAEVAKIPYLIYGTKNKKLAYYDGEDWKLVEGATATGVTTATMLNNDFYAVDSKGKFYKNGVICTESGKIPSDFSRINQMCSAGNSLYTCGSDKSGASVCWKDDKVVLTATSGASFSAICTLGNDVFIAGSNYNTKHISVYKNATQIFDLTYAKNESISGIAVYDGKVYLIVGESSDKKCYRYVYNGTTMIQDAVVDASSIDYFAASGGSLFTAVTMDDQLNIYKNVDWSKVLPSLVGPSGYNLYQIKGIFENGNDNYVVARYRNVTTNKFEAYSLKNSVDPIRMPLDTISSVALMPQ